MVTEWLDLPALAERIDEPLAKVRLWVREGKLVVVPHGDRQVPAVPADLVHDGRLVKGLFGALTVLADAGYRPEEALRWLLTDDPALPGRPVDAMAAGRDAAVKRRAMVLAF